MNWAGILWLLYFFYLFGIVLLRDFSRCNWGMHFLFIYFKATLMDFPGQNSRHFSRAGEGRGWGCVLGLCKGCRLGFVECIWHITFGSLLSNFCVCFGRHFGFVIYGHVKRSRSWSRAVIPLGWPPFGARLCGPMLSMVSGMGASAFDMRSGDAGQKVFALISFSSFFRISLFIFQFSFFGFSRFSFWIFFLVFFFFWFFSLCFCCPIGNC